MLTTAATNTAMPAGTDRRRHHHLREIFEEAVALVAPFFEHDNDWGHGTLDHLAYRTLRDRFPQLSFDEAHVLVVAARRVYAAKATAVRQSEAPG